LSVHGCRKAAALGRSTSAAAANHQIILQGPACATRPSAVPAMLPMCPILVPGFEKAAASDRSSSVAATNT
jgi:hypothetical protein